MGHTNQTANYKFPLFIGGDKPSWMGDFNGAMNNLDKTIKTVANVASGAAGDAANSVAIAEAASDLATAAHDASDANTQAIADIVAGGVKPVPVPISISTAFQTSAGTCSKVGPEILYSIKGKFREHYSPISPNKDFTVCEIPQDFGCTWETMPSEKLFAGMALFTLSGGTRTNVILPAYATLIKRDGSYLWTVRYLDPADEFKNAARDATEVYVAVSGSFNILTTAPAV